MTSLKITYGHKGGPRSGHIREARRGIANPSFTVRPNETPPLRLNTDVGVRFPPDQLAKLPSNEEKLDYLRYEIAGALDLFAQYQRRFLDRYFAFIVDRCRKAASDLSATVAWSGGLFSAEDYVFSALWPLPDAQVLLSANGKETTLGGFDFAFWTGQRVLGITFAGGTVHQNETENHHNNPITDLLMPVLVIARDLQDDTSLFCEPRFPAEFVSFWNGEKAPSSPFRPVGLTDVQLDPA